MWKNKPKMARNCSLYFHICRTEDGIFKVNKNCLYVLPSPSKGKPSGSGTVSGPLIVSSKGDGEVSIFNLGGREESGEWEERVSQPSALATNL